jgi:ankyrin repeat protein
MLGLFIMLCCILASVLCQEPVDLLVESVNGNFNIINKLIKEYKLNPNLKDSSGYTPLIYAVKANQFETVQLLLEAHADPDDSELDGWCSLLFACWADNIPMVKLLTEAGASPFIENKSGMSPKKLNEERQNAEIGALLDAGIPIYESRLAKKEEKALLGRRLVDAARNGDEKEMKELIEMGVDVTTPNAQGWTALTFAAGVGNVANVQMLLSAGSNANQVEEDGWTPVMFAAYQGHTKVVDILLEAGGSATTKSNLGVTVVGATKINTNNDGMLVKHIADHALTEGLKLADGDICVEAIDAGGDVTITNPAGWSSLILFSSLNYPNAVARLLGYTPPEIYSEVINHREDDGWTALMFGSFSGYTDVVRTLLELGADPNVINFNGHNALSIARSKTNTEIIDLLVAAGAVDNNEEQAAAAGEDARALYAKQAKARAEGEHVTREAAELADSKKAAEAEKAKAKSGFFSFFGW